MYGKVLSIPDVLIIKYFNLVTNLNYKEIKDYEFMLDAGKISHRDLKRKLGREIVSLYYDNKLASSAEQHFDNIFVNKGIPDNIPEINISENIKIVDLIKKSNLVNSNSEVRRLIKQGAVKIDDVTISNIHHEIISKGKYIIKIGKRKFLRVNS